MLTVGDLLGNYRVLMQLPYNPSAELYIVDRLKQQTTPILLLLYPTIDLKSSVEQQTFQYTAQSSTIQSNNQTITITEAGIFNNQHPYLTTPYSANAQEALQEQLKLIAQLLTTAYNQHPGDHAALLAAFYQTFRPSAEQPDKTRIAPVALPDARLEQPATQPGASQEAPTQLISSPSEEAPTQLISSPSDEPTIRLNSAEETPAPLVTTATNETPTILSSQPNNQTPIQQSTVADAPTRLVSPPPVTPIVQTGAFAPATPLPLSHPTTNRAFAGTRRSQPWRPNTWQTVVLLLLLLALLGWGGSYLYTIVPASQATITITPVQKALTHTYNLTVGNGTSSDLYTIPGRQLAATSATQSQTVTASGHGNHPATQATGTIVISQIHLDNPGPNGNTLAVSTIPNNNGVNITTNQTTTITEGGTVTIPAHATVAGAGGNIPAHSLDGPIIITNKISQAQIGTGYAANPDAFTGGKEAADFIFIQQSDLDTATQNLTNQLTDPTKAQVKGQIHPDEHFVQDPACTVDNATNHQANDEAADVTITISVTCNALVYTDQALRETAVKAYQSDGIDQLGKDYSVADDVVTSKSATATAIDKQTLSVQADGIWSYSYNAQQQQTLKQSITGKPQSDALSLLKKRKDIKNVALTTSSWFGSAVPASLENIKITINRIKGLHS